MAGPTETRAAAVVAVVPVELASGEPAAVRVVLRYVEPVLVIDGADRETAGRLSRRIRAGLAAAGYVHPVRRVEVALVRRPAGPVGVIRGRVAVMDGPTWEPLPWCESAGLAAAVAVAVAAGQLPPARVAVPVPADTLTDSARVAGAGYVYVQPRRGVAVAEVAGALAVWDRGTLALVAAERAATAGRRARSEALAAMTRAGCSVADMARLTGLGERRIEDLRP